MIRDYDNITPEQEAAETIVFGQWWDWFFEQQDVPQNTTFVLEEGKIRILTDLKDMYMREFPLQESALTYLPGVALSTDREGLLRFVRGLMDDFSRVGYLQ